MMFYMARCRRAGFTLIEIMIVIAIIAILAGIVVPNFREARAEAQLAGCRQNILRIVNAVIMAGMRHSFGELYTAATGYEYIEGNALNISPPRSIPYLVEAGYLENLPRCPSGGGRTVAYGDYNWLLYRYGRWYVTCCAKLGDGYAHLLGNKRIRPRWREGYEADGSTVSTADQNGCWDDIVEYE